MNLPAPHIIVFDGVCNLCSTGVQFIVRRDRDAYFRFASIQSDIGQAIYRANGLDPENPQSILVVSESGALIRSDAAIEIARHLNGFWRVLVVFKFLPRWFRDWAYGVVAHNRYRWFGKKESCMLPSPDIRKRFL